jgi:hypothetical protein
MEEVLTGLRRLRLRRIALGNERKSVESGGAAVGLLLLLLMMSLMATVVVVDVKLLLLVLLAVTREYLRDGIWWMCLAFRGTTSDLRWRSPLSQLLLRQQVALL